MTDESPTDRVVDHRTNHWTGVGAVALVAGGLGVLLRQPGLVLASVVGIAFAGYAGTARPLRVRDERDDPTLSIRRQLSEATPDPGETVTVTVEVRNDGDGILPDVRLVDGVPPELEVTAGSPRHGASLRPGGSAVYSYEVTATRGEHTWQRAQVTVADPSGTIERETGIDAATTLRCTLPALESGRLPLRGLTTRYAGRVPTDVGGSGVEFFAAREYRPTDPRNRIDWRRLAKTGEFGTLEFREERAATVALVIDTRKAAYRAPEPGGYHAVERSVDAANRVFAALLAEGDRAGITTLGGSHEECWLAPSTGDDHRARGRALLNSHPALSPIPPAREQYETLRPERREELERRRITRLHERLPADAQVIVLSPCLDGYLPEVARLLESYGHPTTVISPDPTTDDTPYRELASMERDDRIAALRRDDVRVVDWAADEPFTGALARAQERWSV